MPTLQLELPPALERALEADAQRAGLAPSALAIQVLAQKYGEFTDPDWQRVFALLDEVGPQVESGTLQPISADDVTDWIEAGRQSRTERLGDLFASRSEEK